LKYQHHVVVDAPVERVFNYMDDVAREKEWQPGIQDAYKEPAGETSVGTRKRYVSEFMGRRIENTYVTKRFEPNERVTYESTPESVIRATVDLRFESMGGKTKVTMAVHGKPTGVLRFIPQGILEGAFRKELEGSLGLLKKQLEGGT
jgi:carbon monoxide dehydrogenase subunit G